MANEVRPEPLLLRQPGPGCVARGVTTRDASEALMDRPESEWGAPLILHADWTCGWKRARNPFPPQPFEVRDIALGHGGTNNPPGRALLRIHQPGAGRTALFYPNYKNSHAANGVRIPARNWVKTPCFHVWIDR